MVPSLPAELIADIFTKVAEAETLHKRDLGTMANLCLVSKSFLPFAQRQLYRVVKLSLSERPRPRQPVDTRSSEDEEQTRDSDAYRETLLLAATLRTSSELARFVKVLLLTGGGYGSTVGGEGAELAKEVLVASPSIPEVELSHFSEGGSGIDALAAALSLGSNIRILHTNSVRAAPNGTLMSSIFQLDLEELHLVNHGSRYFGNALFSTRPPRFRLRSFTNRSADARDFDTILRTSHSSLRSLHILSSGVPFDLSPFANLESLHLECHHSMGGTLADILSTLSSLPLSLTSLHLHSVYRLRTRPTPAELAFCDELGALRLLHSLPTSLRLLDLRNFLLSPSYILDFIADPSACPNLIRLDAPSTLGEQDCANLPQLLDEMNEELWKTYDVKFEEHTEEEVMLATQYIADQDEFGHGVVGEARKACAARGWRMLAGLR